MLYKRARQWLGKTLATFRGRVAVLLYHRVAEPSFDPHLLCVTPRHFCEQLDYLRARWHVIGVQDLVSGLRCGTLPKRCVLVTFDDGYVDNLVYGKPLLERFGVPAVVFVASGYVGSGRRFWWDELAEIFFGALRLPRVLRIAVEERQWEWVLDGGQGGSRVGVDKWHVESRYDPTPSHRAYRELHWLLRGLGRASREEVLNQLRAQTDGLERGDAECRPMTPEEVRWLVKGGLVNVGAHTVSHPVLARLPVEAQRFEIRQSKSDLESVVGRPVSCFAYPYGDRLSVGDVAVDLVREAGYTIGFGNFPGWVVGGRAQPWWYLPRWSVRDWDGEEFARRLEDFLG